jgi:hypothetical protein
MTTVMLLSGHLIFLIVSHDLLKVRDVLCHLHYICTGHDLSLRVPYRLTAQHVHAPHCNITRHTLHPGAPCTALPRASYHTSKHVWHRTSRSAPVIPHMTPPLAPTHNPPTSHRAHHGCVPIIPTHQMRLAHTSRSTMNQLNKRLDGMTAALACTPSANQNKPPQTRHRSSR